MRSQIRRARYLRQVKKHPPILRPETLRRAATWIIYARVGDEEVVAAQLGGVGRHAQLTVCPVNRASIYRIQLLDNRAIGVTVTARVRRGHVRSDVVRLSEVRHLRGTPAPRIEVDCRICVDVLVNACGSDRRRVSVAGAALVGHEGTNLVDDSHILRVRSRRRPSIGLVAHRTARAAAAAPLEGEVAVVVYAEMVKCCGRPGAPAASDVVAVLAVVVRAVAAASRLDDVVSVWVDFGHKPDVVIVHEPANVGIGIVVIEQIVNHAHDDFWRSDLAGVYTAVRPEDRFGAWYVTVRDV